MEQLKQALKLAFASIALLEKDAAAKITASGSGSISISILKPLLDDLAELLRNYDITSIERLEEITALKGKTNFDKKIDEMKICTDKYDFEGALKILGDINSNSGEERYSDN